MKWAVAELTDSQQLLSQEKKMNRKTARKVRRSEIEKLTDDLKNVELVAQPIDVVKPIVNLELNRSTVLYLSNKEFNKNGIEILNELLLEPDNSSIGSLHRLLFAGKEEAKQLLEIECKFVRIEYFESLYGCTHLSDTYSAKSQGFDHRFNWSRVHTTVELQSGSGNQ